MTNFLYNPDKKNKSQLIAEFVVRTGVFDEIMHDLETSVMKTPEQHYLLVGQRGSGKTTLLNRIKYAVEDAPKLKDWLIPVIFSEEQYNMSELANLWESVGQILEDYHDFEDIAVNIDKHALSANFEERAYELLEAELKKRGKKLLLLIDNIGDFLKKLDDREIRRLREILQTRPYLRIIAGSPFYLESLLDYQQPFFEFFKVLRLDGLSQVETVHLLRKLGEVYNEQEKINTIIENTPERIETLRILTGGVPRTIALMFRIFIEHAHDNSVNDLERVLDAVTPLYKHRMDDLPTQQQKIVDAVAKNWDPITVKDLKGRVRIDSKVVSAQLRQLEKDQVIEKRESDTKNHYYLLKERFFNIWYLMRYGRKQDRRRALWLVRFLESWCSNTDIEERIELFVEEIKNKKLSDERIDFFADVYASMQTLTAKAKATLKQSGLPKMNDAISLNDVELTELAQAEITKKDYSQALDWFSQLSSLGANKKTIIELALALERQNAMNIYDAKRSEWSNNKSQVPIAQFEIMTLFFLLSCAIQTSYARLRKEPEIEWVIKLFKSSLGVLADYVEGIESSPFPLDLNRESFLLAVWLREIIELSLINSAIDSFDTHERADTIKIAFDPIYKALLIISGKITYSQLPAEKVELIRNIASSITK